MDIVLKIGEIMVLTTALAIAATSFATDSTTPPCLGLLAATDSSLCIKFKAPSETALDPRESPVPLAEGYNTGGGGGGSGDPTQTLITKMRQSALSPHIMTSEIQDSVV